MDILCLASKSASLSAFLFQSCEQNRQQEHHLKKASFYVQRRRESIGNKHQPVFE
jgi:hypothetical protein